MNNNIAQVYPWEAEGINWFSWWYQQHGVKQAKLDALREAKFQAESLKEYQVEMFFKAKQNIIATHNQGKWWEAQHASFYDNLELKEALFAHFRDEEDRKIEIGK